MKKGTHRPHIKKLMEIDEQDNLYIIRVFDKNGRALIKLGYSTQIRKRLMAYFNHNPYTEILATYHREDAERIEMEFHRDHPSEILNEWYKEDELFYMLSEIG